MSFFWKTASRIAWRETRGSTVKFGFVILAVAVGVGALSGVRGFSDGFRGTLLREARQIMAADVSVRIFGSATPEQARLLDVAPGSALLMVSRRTVSQGAVASVARLYHPGARYRLVGRFSV